MDYVVIVTLFGPLQVVFISLSWAKNWKVYVTPWINVPPVWDNITHKASFENQLAPMLKYGNYRHKLDFLIIQYTKKVWK